MEQRSTTIPEELVDEIKRGWNATPDLQREAWDWCCSAADDEVRTARANALIELYNEIGMCRSKLIHPQLLGMVRVGTQANPIAFEIARRAAVDRPVPVAPSDLDALRESGFVQGVYR